MKFLETTKKDSSGEPIKLAYQDYGSGKPVLLIHGWPLSKEMWEYQIEALVLGGYRVITYDRRGFGKSCRPWDGYDYDTLTADLKEVIDGLKLEDVTLVGFSMGGGEVARYFKNYGGAKVSKAVLISSVTPYMLKTEDNPDGTPKEMFDEFAEKIKDDRIGFLDTFNKPFFGINLVNKPLSTPLFDYFGALCAKASPRATLACLRAFSETDFRPDMKSITVPTLIIHGDSDKTVPIKAAADQSAKMIPNNKYIVYEGEPHGLFYTSKERLNQDLLDFLSGKSK